MVDEDKLLVLSSQKKEKVGERKPLRKHFSREFCLIFLNIHRRLTVLIHTALIDCRIDQKERHFDFIQC